MRRGALLAMAATLCTAAVLAAPAGAWVETSTYDVPSGGVADCLRVAGPGQLALLGPLTRTSTPLDLLDVGAGSLTPTGSVPLDPLDTCPEVAASAGGQPPVSAEAAQDPNGGVLDEVVRVASAGRAPVTLPGPRGYVLELAAAEGPDGTAAVAWLVALDGGTGRTHLLVAIRPAHADTFDAPVTLSDTASADTRPAVGLDAAGHVTVAWIDAPQPAGALPLPSAPFDAPRLLRVAEASSATGYGAPQTVTPTSGSSVALAVTPQGRALLAADDLHSLHVWERLPGTPSFAPVRLPAQGASEGLAVALNPDGGAVIAYDEGDSSRYALVRRPGGTFSREQTLVPLAPPDFPSSSSIVFIKARRGSIVPPDDEHGGDLTAALAPDGEALLSWVDEASGTDTAPASVVHGTLAHGFGKPHRLGSPCRSAAAARPLALADGRLGVAWADDARTTVIGYQAIDAGQGSVHVALAGGVPSRLPGPPVHLAAHLLAGTRPLGPAEPLRVRVRCRARCDVRAATIARQLPQPRWTPGGGSRGGDPFPTSASTSLPAGGAATLTLQMIDGYDIAGIRGRRQTPIVVLACTPDGPIAQQMNLAPPPIRPPLPVPRVVDLRARRQGTVVRVTWRTTLPARDARFQLYGALRSGDPASRPVRVAGRGRTRFAVALHPLHGQQIEHVSLQLRSPEILFAFLEVRVR